MIARINGQLESVLKESVLLRVEGGLTYQVLVPSYVVPQLAGQIGSSVTLHTLYYLESQNQGATMTPRLAGFLSEVDRDFFELFTTCKGIGNRKALRAMTIATDQIAAAIADRDVSLLQTMPEIGRRTAETVVATLHGKVDRFATSTAFGGDAQSGQSPTSNISREALAVLMQLGEARTEAVNWIDRVMRDPDNQPVDVEELVRRVFVVKAGA